MARPGSSKPAPEPGDASPTQSSWCCGLPWRGSRRAGKVAEAQERPSKIDQPATVSTPGAPQGSQAPLNDQPTSSPAKSPSYHTHDPPTKIDISSGTVANVEPSLWAKAYELLRQDTETARLLEEYERILLHVEGQEPRSATECQSKDAQIGNDGGETGDAGQRLEKVQELAQTRLNRLSESQLSVKVGKKEIVVREQVGKLVRVVIKFKDAVSTAVSSQPLAGVAWAGVLIVLPLVDNILQQDSAAAAGFERVSFMLIKYQLIEEDLEKLKVPQLSHSSRLALAEGVVDVYSQICGYLIRIVVHFAKHKFARVMRDAIGYYDWKEMLTNLETHDRQIQDTFISLSNSSLLHEMNKCLQNQAEIRSDMEKIIDTTQATQDFEVLSSLPFADRAVFDSHEVHKYGKCIEGTQLNTLSKIYEWLEQPDGEPIFWLYGMAGTGKTSITRYVADALDEGSSISSTTSGDRQLTPSRAVLGGSFFFRQEDNKRNSTEAFFTTLAVSLAQRLPILKKHIVTAVKNNQNIGTKYISQQADKLIIEPLLAMEKESHLLIPIRIIVVVDALDECVDRSEAVLLLQQFSRLSCFDQVEIRVLMVSRREPHIVNEMSEMRHYGLQLQKIRIQSPTTTVSPDAKFGGSGADDAPSQASESPKRVDDITRFLQHERDQIAKRHKISASWLGTDDIAQLHAKCDGLFIYAATACRFLDDGDSELREQRLDALLRGEGSPQTRLDDIYRVVLCFPLQNRSEKEGAQLLFRIRQILGVIMMLFTPVAIPTLHHFLPEMKKDTLDLRLKQLHSVLDVPEDESQPIELVHASFSDFLLDEKRSGNLAINTIEAHTRLFQQSLGIMERELRQDMCDLQLPAQLVSELSPGKVNGHLSPQLRYACRYWGDHFDAIDNLREGASTAWLQDDGIIHGFLKRQLLFWLEALSLIQELPTAIYTIISLSEMVNNEHAPQLAAFLHDAKRFILCHRYIIERAPLQTYISALIFSPTNSIVRGQYLHLRPPWITHSSSAGDDWGPELFVLQNSSVPADTMNYGHMSFSASTKGLIALGTGDNRVSICDAVTGGERANYRLSLKSPIVGMSYSSETEQIFVNTIDTVGILSTRDGSFINLSDRIAKYQVAAELPVLVTLLSPGDDRVLIVNRDGALVLWQIRKRSEPLTFNLTEGLSDVHNLAFMGEVKNDRFQDKNKDEPDSNVPMLVFLAGFCPSNCTVAVLLRASSRQRPSCLTDKPIEKFVLLWSVQKNRTTATIQHDSDVVALAFSLDGLGASGDEDGCIKVWNPKTGDVMHVISHGRNLWSLALSRVNGKEIVAVGGNGLRRDKLTLYYDLVTMAKVVLSTETTHDLIEQLKFSLDGSLLASRSQTGVHLWDCDSAIRLGSASSATARSCEIHQLPGSIDCIGIMWDGHMRVWNYRTGTTTWHSDLSVHIDTAMHLHFSPDGKLSYLIDDDSSTATIYEGGTTVPMAHFENIRWVVFSSDCQYMVSHSHGAPATVLLLGRTARGWEVTQKLNRDEPHWNHKDEPLIYQPQFISSTNLFILQIQLRERENGEDRLVIVQVWNAETGSKIVEYASDDEYLPYKISPAGDFVLINRIIGKTGVGMSRFILWDPVLQQERKGFLTCLWDACHRHRVAISQDWRYVVSTDWMGGDGSVYIEELETGNVCTEIPANPPPDRPKTWDLDEPKGGMRGCGGVALAGKGCNLLAAIQSAWHDIVILRFWDTESRQQVGDLMVDGGDYASLSLPHDFPLAFSEDSRTVKTVFGRVPVPRPVPWNPAQPLSDAELGCLHVMKEWVIQGFAGLVWIPPAYRVQICDRKTLHVTDSIVVVGRGHGDNPFWFVEFDLLATPLA